jgi:cytochrome c oxidase subunit 3
VLDGDPTPPYRTERITRQAPLTPTIEPIAVGNTSSSARRLGMWLFIASLAMFFGASLVGYLVIRMRAEIWPPPGSPVLPAGLWISTALLVLLSVLLAFGERSVRGGREEGLTRMLSAATLVSVAFLAAQVSNWMRMASDSVLPRQSLLVWGFYTLTFLHALHVLAGLVPLILVTLRARRDCYTATDHEGVHLVALYWHFLAVAWVAILIVLLI